jgi:hypothetical protein
MADIEIEAFRADTKASKGLTASHIAEAASLYDADKNPAPLVFGHPTNDSPALGVVSGARAAGNKLFLKLANVAEDLKTAVRERRVLNRSIAFWDPDHPSNPNPGKYSIRHLGFLGGQAPAIPGMKLLKFSADEDGFEELPDPADAIVFAVEEAPTPTQTIKESKPKEPVMEFTAEQIAEMKAKADRADEAEAKAARLEKAEADRQAEFAAAETARRTAENEAALTAAVEAGKVTPAEKDDLAKLFEALDVKPLVFSAGEKEPRLVLASFIDALPKRAPAKGESQASPTGEFSANDRADAAEQARIASEERTRNAWKGAAAA